MAEKSEPLHLVVVPNEDQRPYVEVGHYFALGPHAHKTPGGGDDIDGDELVLLSQLRVYIGDVRNKPHGNI